MLYIVRDILLSSSPPWFLLTLASSVPIRVSTNPTTSKFMTNTPADANVGPPGRRRGPYSTLILKIHNKLCGPVIIPT